MADDRRQFIENIENSRQGRVICYLTSDRQQFTAQIASDVLPIFYKHLQNIGHTEKIVLFLSSNGGALEAPWPLVGLLREYCNQLEVIVPGKALSAATLIALGANRIVMGPASYLSPIDPRQVVLTGGQLQETEIEDIFGFVDFARDQIGLRGEQALTEVLHQLSDKVGPVTLGSINRTYHLIRGLAKRLLLLHMDYQKDKARLDLIVNNLAQRLYSHNHLIYRSEARDDLGFGDMIEYATDDLLRIMDDLYSPFVKFLGIGASFNPADFVQIETLQSQQSQIVEIPRAVIQSRDLLPSVFMTTANVVFDSETKNIQVKPLVDGWKEISNE